MTEQEADHGQLVACGVRRLHALVRDKRVERLEDPLVVLDRLAALIEERDQLRPELWSEEIDRQLRLLRPVLHAGEGIGDGLQDIRRYELCPRRDAGLCQHHVQCLGLVGELVRGLPRAVTPRHDAAVDLDPVLLGHGEAVPELHHAVIGTRRVQLVQRIAQRGDGLDEVACPHACLHAGILERLQVLRGDAERFREIV